METTSRRSATPRSSRGSALLWLRSLLAALLLPGTFAGLVPLWILRSTGAAAPSRVGPLVLAGALALGGGLALLGRCIRDFAVVGRGTLAPVDAPRRLVVSGPYRWVRNPMYLAVLAIVLGQAALFRSRPLALYALGAFTAIQLFVRFYEEPTLEARFGEEYRAYRREVRRWLPRLRDPRRRSGSA
jgi:protein-S-isoprenylcysteine O-methyltransferase Ste14